MKIVNIEEADVNTKSRDGLILVSGILEQVFAWVTKIHQKTEAVNHRLEYILVKLHGGEVIKLSNFIYTSNFSNIISLGNEVDLYITRMKNIFSRTKNVLVGAQTNADVEVIITPPFLSAQVYLIGLVSGFAVGLFACILALIPISIINSDEFMWIFQFIFLGSIAGFLYLAYKEDQKMDWIRQLSVKLKGYDGSSDTYKGATIKEF